MIEISRVSKFFNPYGLTDYSCHVCDHYFSPIEFAIDSDGISLTCLSCYMLENKISPRQFARVLKIAIGCEVASCLGYPKNSFALQFDHISPATKYRTKSGKILEPSDLFYSCGIATFCAEIVKCVISCANCHAIKTAKERGLI
jgi:hypothetical protein